MMLISLAIVMETGHAANSRMAQTGLFLGVIAALGGVGAGILQMIGPPVPVDDLAQDERADAIFVEFASRVPTVAADAAQVAAVETPSDAD